jgi:hypothetical protein
MVRPVQDTVFSALVLSQGRTTADNIWDVLECLGVQQCSKSHTLDLSSEMSGVDQLRLGHIATWLILPVVICLSQRLSHACLSKSFNTVKLRTAHYISYSLFDGTLPLGYPW